jgi:DNA-binding response OmpR family regulator
LCHIRAVGVGARARTVLIVDDEPSIRLLCRVNLEIEGYRVLEASGVGEARALLRDDSVDILLVDLHLDDGDGRQVVDELRASGARVPVALLTGTVDLSAEDRLAVDAVLEKPFRLEQLLETVRKLESG